MEQCAVVYKLRFTSTVNAGICSAAQNYFLLHFIVILQILGQLQRYVQLHCPIIRFHVTQYLVAKCGIKLMHILGHFLSSFS